MSDKKNYSPAKGRPPSGGIKKFLWDPCTGEFLGRTGARWLKTTIFYIIFFACLATFCGTNYWIFHQTLDLTKPKWIGDNGLIGSNPGLGFRPMPDQDTNDGSTLIWYKRGDTNTSKFWTDQLGSLFNASAAAAGSFRDACGWGEGEGANFEKYCRVPVEKITGSCNEANHFGYQQGQPCILIKLNKIYDWVPDAYTSVDKDTFPLDMPVDLQNKILKTPPAQKHVWFSCEGENPSDRENLGEVEYIPNQGIPTYHFPYKNQYGFQSPFIYLQLRNPLKSVLINIECTAWAKNIHPSRPDRAGSVHFEIMID